MMTLNTMTPFIRTLYITVLIALWVGATIANIATLFQLDVDLLGLVAISVFIAGMVMRSYTIMNRA
jgi:hypothetical protein